MVWKKLLPFLLFLLLASVVTIPSTAKESLTAWQREQALKARIIHGFIKFTRWQELPEANFSVCILGDNPELLKRLRAFFLAGKTPEYQSKRIIVMKINVEKITDCSILYIAASEELVLADVVKKVADLPILTFSASPGFALRGVQVNFYVENNQIRFEVNLDAVRQAGLMLESKLLSYAKIVKGGRS